MIAPARPLAPAAMIMAGGRGARMAPSHACPKPLVRLSGMTLIEINLRKCLAAGFRPVTLALGHRADEIAAHVRALDGLPDREVELVIEREPLGTAGALRLLPPSTGTALLVNGDLLSGIDLAEMLAFHERGHAALTIAVHPEHHRLQLGEVVTGDGDRVADYLEKPLKQYRISSGTYLLEPEARALVPADRPCDVPDLVRAAVGAGLCVLAFAHARPWIDVNDSRLAARAESMLRESPEVFGVERARLVAEGSAP